MLLSEQWGRLMVTNNPIPGFVIDFSVFFSLGAAVFFQMLSAVAQLRYLYHSCIKISNGEESTSRTGTLSDLFLQTIKNQGHPPCDSTLYR